MGDEGPTRARVALSLCLLTLLYTINVVDRQLPFILIESLRAELRMTDTQIGLLGGIAFSIVYAGMSLPLARLADAWSPKWALVGAAAFWSCATALSAGATSFLWLAAGRVGVAAGEAGCVPASHALIARLATERRRGIAMGIFMLGSPFGIMLGLALGGWMNDNWGWRTAFLAAGGVGLLLAILTALVVPDLRDRAVRPPSSLLRDAAVLLQTRSFLRLFIACNFVGVLAYAVLTFGAPFFMRTYGLSAAEAGLGLGVTSGFGGLIGTLAGSWLTDRFGARQRGRVLWIPLTGLLVAAICYVIGLWASSWSVALAFVGVAIGAQAMHVTPTFVAGQALAAGHMKAQASALLVLAGALVGAALGPLLVGSLSDRLSETHGALSLRYALSIVAPTAAVLAAIFYARALAAFETDLRDFQSSEEQNG